MFMVIPAKSKNNSRSIRRRNAIIASLLIVAVVVSLCAYLLVMNSGNVIHVKNEKELVKAFNDVKLDGSAVIVLDNDIELTNTVGILDRKNITLTSNGDNTFKLFGADRTTTLSVGRGGVMVLDGIVVTHAEGADGSGVDNSGGTLIMYSGKISGNTFRYGSGGGVTVSNGGVFEMYGGEIVNNVARVSGGGVSINDGVFSMFGGVISGNAVSGLGGFGGGGVYRYEWGGTFNWHGGEIYGNTADSNEDIYDP
jgi:hypothetical protein